MDPPLETYSICTDPSHKKKTPVDRSITQWTISHSYDFALMLTRREASAS